MNQEIQSVNRKSDHQYESRLVLVIDDSPTQTMVIHEFLTGVGLQVVTASNGESGIDLAHSTHPVLVLLDVHMPDMNGFEVCKHLKNDPATLDIPIIMFTRNDSLDAVQNGLGLGAVDYIPKDAFAMTVLLETLRQMGLVNGRKIRG